MLLFLCVVVGCGDSANLDKEREHNFIGICKQIQYRDTWPDYSKKAAAKILQNIDNNIIDQIPVLIRAKCVWREGNSCKLAVILYDEDNDLIGIGIREKHDGPEINVLEEKYPVFERRLVIGHPEIIPVKIRDNNQRKDVSEWNDYLRQEMSDLSHSSLPSVWLSLPNPPMVEIEVWVYDQKGNKSNIVPLINGIEEEFNEIDMYN